MPKRSKVIFSLTQITVRMERLKANVLAGLEMWPIYKSPWCTPATYLLFMLAISLVDVD